MTGFPSNYFISAFVLVSPTTFLVSARSHYHSPNSGGVWASHDAGGTWTKTLSRPVYDLVREPSSGAVLAALPWVGDAQSIYLSRSGGTSEDWMPAAQGISWDGRTPFYPTFALSGDGQRLFVGALTVNPAKLSDTASAIYHVAVADFLTEDGGSAGSSAVWNRVEGDPTLGHLDQDGMPKDRMALLVHPHNSSILFVAGNAGSLAWRVDWQGAQWTKAFGMDTADASTPHVDCRR
jgi:hypothetical protein